MFAGYYFCLFALLAAVMDGRRHKAGFYHLRLALHLSVLVLVKSMGFYGRPEVFPESGGAAFL